MEELILKLHVTPRGSKNQIIGWREETLCIKITAPPVEGAANSAIIKFLSDTLKIKKSQIEMVSGEKSREKSVKITGITIQDVKAVLG